MMFLSLTHPVTVRVEMLESGCIHNIKEVFLKPVSVPGFTVSPHIYITAVYDNA